MEFKSKASFLGLPLVHVAFGLRDEVPGKKGVARGWIAVGDVACGVLVAVGGVATGGVAIGGASLGVVGLGGLAVAGVAAGGLAAGILALGGCALGYLSLGGLAVAWQGALGGAAVAHEYALGGAAFGAHANDAAARAFFTGHPFFEVGQLLMAHSRWLLLLTVLPALLPWLKRGREEGRRDL